MNTFIGYRAVLLYMYRMTHRQMKKGKNSVVNHVFCKHGFYNYLMNLCTLFVSLFAVRDGSRTAATSKMELFLIIVNGLQRNWRRNWRRDFNTKPFNI